MKIRYLITEFHGTPEKGRDPRKNGKNFSGCPVVILRELSGAPTKFEKMKMVGK